MLLLAGEHDRGARRGGGVRHDGADAGSQLEVLEQERDAQGDVSYGRVGRDRSSAGRARRDPRAAHVFGAHALGEAAGGLEPAFFDTRDPRVGDALRDWRPGSSWPSAPTTSPAGALDGLDRARVLGVVTEPLPGGGRADHPNLHYNRAELARADARRFDRVIVTDPSSADAAAALLPVWRRCRCRSTTRSTAPRAPAPGRRGSSTSATRRCTASRP